MFVIIFLSILLLVCVTGVAFIIWFAIADIKQEANKKYSACSGDCANCPNAKKEGIKISTCNKCNRTFGWEKKDILVKLHNELIIQCPHCQQMAHIFIDD